jgi:hypothetical protein
MADFKRISHLLLGSTACFALAACGADDIASPGTGGNVTINNITPPPPPPPPPPPASTLVTPAPGCPTVSDPQGLTDSGTITGPTGTYRVCTLPARFNASSTLTRVPGLLYRLGGRVDIGTDQGPTEETTDAADVVLTIEPGVVIFAGVGVAWMNVNRGNRIQAVGTAARPIVITSRDNILGLNGEDSSGQWGGLVLSGRAPVTDCAAPAATPGTIACERQVEGAVDPALFGGASPNDNSGRVSFVQLRYSGFVLSGNNELQALTTGGTGSATILDNIQAVNSSDDGMEFFGGVVNAKNLAIIGAEDDNLDTDTGIKGNFQFVVAVQRAGIGDSMIEADSDNASDGNTPRQNTRLANFTFVQRNNIANLTAILLRGGTDYSLVNGVMVSPTTTCFAISRAQTASATVDAAIDEAGAPFIRSFVAQCPTTAFSGRNTVTEAQVSTIFGAGANNNSVTFAPTLSGTFINGTAETAVTPFAAASLNGPLNGTQTTFFETVPYIGAVRDAIDTRFSGWTCNTAAANFGTGNSGACTTVPTI